jgi:hypothetical protein
MPEEDEVDVVVSPVDEDVVVVVSSPHPASRAKDEAAETMASARANRACIENLLKLKWAPQIGRRELPRRREGWFHIEILARCAGAC